MLLSTLRHERTDKFHKLVIETLHEKYDGNIVYYDRAEQDAKDHIKNIRKLKNAALTANTVTSPTDLKKYKVTNLDLEKKIVTLSFVNESEILLAYNLDYLTYSRILPYTVNTFLDKSKSRDLQKHKSSDEVETVVNWVRQKVLGLNFSVTQLSLDKSNSVFSFGSTMSDPLYGTLMQNITARIPSDKDFAIGAANLKGKPVDLAKDYESLFNYFMMFGLTEVHARCNCPDYYSKYMARKGIANYFCPHLMYAMSQFPYYLMYTLYNR